VNRTAQVLARLRAYESRNVTYMDPDGSWPIVWERAQGVHVWDAAGRRYLDLTAAFGVAAAGHANARVVRAARQQMPELLHAMGDVHPHALKADLACELSRLTFERWQNSTRKGWSGKTIFCNSGFEAVEAALKTALLATGRSGVVAFEGAYHGLGYGALNATHRAHFRSPFRRQLREFAHFVPFPLAAPAPGQFASRQRSPTGSVPTLTEVEARLRAVLRRQQVGAVLVEPVQARGGIHIPPAGFLPLLRRLCDEYDALLVLDEIYTGFGRTGKWFACEHSGVIPDLICLGKALTGGFPLSACIGRADLMDAAWPASTGEAIHTSTFLGHPVGCAMALAQISELRRLKLVERSALLGSSFRRDLEGLRGAGPGLLASVRGLGLMVGLELRRRDDSPATTESLALIKAMLGRGYILLPEGEHSNVLSFTPPLTITGPQLNRTLAALGRALAGLART
jgi:4-aminobutyrate aminotransferase-like enzyme